MASDLGPFCIARDAQHLRVLVGVRTPIVQADLVVQLEPVGIRGHRAAVGAMRIRQPDTQPAILQLAACHALGAGRGRSGQSGNGHCKARLECREFHAESLCDLVGCYLLHTARRLCPFPRTPCPACGPLIAIGGEVPYARKRPRGQSNTLTGRSNS